MSVVTTESFVSDIDSILTSAGHLAKKYDDIKEEWKLDNLSADTSLAEMCEDATSEISYNNYKLNSEDMFCVIFGRVSSGKSSVINAMLGSSILPSSEGSTTNSFVEIRQSNDNSEYLIFPDSEEKESLDLISRVQFGEENVKFNDSLVKLYYSKGHCELLHKNVVIVDTPGIDIENETDKIINGRCKQAGVLIIVINSANDINKTEKNFLLKHKTTFSRFDLIVVFNQWDKVDESNKAFLRTKYTKSANDYLCDILKVKNNRDDEGIFFLSATERLMLNSAKNPETNGWEQRQDSFEDFMKLINEKLIQFSQNKRTIIKDMNLGIITGVINTINETKFDISSGLIRKVDDYLKEFTFINAEINEIVTKIFKQNYEIFLDRVLSTMRLIESGSEDGISLLYIFLAEQITVLIEFSKTVINDNVNHMSTEKKEWIIKILENLYFPYYFNIDLLMSVLNVDDLTPTFKEIMQKISRFRKVATAGLAAAGVLIVAPIGVGIGIAVPIIDAVAIPVAAVTMGGVGGAGAAVSSWFTLARAKMERVVFKGRYEEEENQIKYWWSLMTALLLDSYANFEQHIPTTIDRYMSNLDSDFEKLKKDASQVLEFNSIIRTMY